ncbi:MAG TPA: MFS transporter [Burkholderiaceae bacterium]|nr:MFS transporter [Burkholderiaceae bacterium]
MSLYPLPPHRERWLLWTLAGIQFTHILDFMIMMPLGPAFVRAFGISTQQFGFLVSAYTFSAGLSGLLAASFVDRFDRRRVVLGAYAVFALATLACAFAPGYASLLAARCLAGMFGGILGAMVFTVIGDAIPFERRGRATGIVMASFSISTIAGVPLGLWISQIAGWHGPFVFIAVLCAGFWWIGWRALPSLASHVAGDDRRAPSPMRTVLRDANHWRAWCFVALMMLSGFTVIPFITLYYTANVGIAESAIPLVYLFGGACTFFTSRWFGRLADRHGKQRVYRWIAIGSLVPLFSTTHLPAAPLWIALVNSTLFFVLVSGRMVPGMAMVTSAANPRLRGTFMSINSAIQSASSGIASLIAGIIITTNPTGQLERYGWVGFIAMSATVCAMWLAGRVNPTDAQATSAEVATRTP